MAGVTCELTLVFEDFVTFFGSEDFLESFFLITFKRSLMAES